MPGRGPLAHTALVQRPYCDPKQFIQCASGFTSALTTCGLGNTTQQYPRRFLLLPTDLQVASVERIPCGVGCTVTVQSQWNGCPSTVRFGYGVLHENGHLPIARVLVPGLTLFGAICMHLCKDFMRQSNQMFFQNPGAFVFVPLGNVGSIHLAEC